MNLQKREFFILLLLFIICLVFFFYKIGSYRLIDVDEPRYAEAAREMISSSNWIIPHFNYELRLDKPIFFYWLVAISYLIFGVSEFAARFPSAIMASLLVFSTYYFGRKIISDTFGLISAVILASSLEFLVLARMSITDMTLAFFTCAALYSGFLGGFLAGKSRKYWWWLAYFFSGIAVLTKGPVGFILPAAIFGIYFLLTGSLKENLKLKFTIPGIFIFILTAVPWYFLIIREQGFAFINYFFVLNNLQRYATNELGHGQPVYFYVLVLLGGLFPWTVYFISLMIKHISLMVKHLKEHKVRNADYDNNFKLILFSLIWFMVIFTFYSISNAKMLSYILPLFPACALLIGNSWHEYLIDDKNSKSMVISTVITSALYILIAVLAILILNFALMKYQWLSTVIYPVAALLVLIAALNLFFAYKGCKLQIFAGFVIMVTSLLIIAANNINSLLYNFEQKDIVNELKIIKNIKLPDKKIVAYDLIKPSLVYYYNGKIIDIQDGDFASFDKYLASPMFVLSKMTALTKFRSNTNFMS